MVRERERERQERERESAKERWSEREKEMLSCFQHLELSSGVAQKVVNDAQYDAQTKIIKRTAGISSLIYRPKV